MIDSNLNNFIGSGIIFPIKLNSFGRPDIISGFDLINSSIKTALSWSIGTRYMLGEFGSKLEELIEEPNDSILQGLVKHFVTGTLNTWVTTIDVSDVTIKQRDEVRMEINITYKIKNSNLGNTFIFPYYSQLKY